jgi:hypothetical protein
MTAILARVMLFDLLFIGFVFTSVITLVVIIGCVVLGRLRRAIKLLALLGVCLALYLGVVVVVSLTSPQIVLARGEDRCFDDWCIAVDDTAHAESVYTVTIRMSNRARRVSQRENGVAVYVVDEQGRRYESVADPSAALFDILLQPGQSITATRTFEVSGASGQPVLVVGHDGATRFPGVFIIGDDSSLLHKPTIVRLP